jgi:hypothetical protein
LIINVKLKLIKIKKPIATSLMLEPTSKNPKNDNTKYLTTIDIFDKNNKIIHGAIVILAYIIFVISIK